MIDIVFQRQKGKFRFTHSTSVLMPTSEDVIMSGRSLTNQPRTYRTALLTCVRFIYHLPTARRHGADSFYSLS